MEMPEQGREERVCCHAEGGGPDRQVQRGPTVDRTDLRAFLRGVDLSFCLFTEITSQDQWKPGSKCQPFLFG